MDVKIGLHLPQLSAKIKCLFWNKVHNFLRSLLETSTDSATCACVCLIWCQLAAMADNIWQVKSLHAACTSLAGVKLINHGLIWQHKQPFEWSFACTYSDNKNLLLPLQNKTHDSKLFNDRMRVCLHLVSLFAAYTVMRFIEIYTVRSEKIPHSVFWHNFKQICSLACEIHFCRWRGVGKKHTKLKLCLFTTAGRCVRLLVYYLRSLSWEAFHFKN